MLLCQHISHNRKIKSLTGAVHYCSRCGIVTRDNRRRWLKVASVKWVIGGTKIVFGAGGQEFRGVVEKIDYAANRIALSGVVAVQPWRTKLSKVRAAFKRLINLDWAR
jgi:hypothetical protein